MGIVSNDAISYRFYPIQRKFRVINRAEILRLEIVSYDPLVDYGGWGIRIGRKGRAYTTSGNKGLLIAPMGKKNILIGTCKPQELEAFLKQHGYPG
jgi:hypothetical protein